MLIDRSLQVAASAIAWPDSIGAGAQHEILIHALAAVAHESIITPDALVKSCALELQSYRKRRWQEYVVVSSISLAPETPLRPCEIERMRIRFSTKLSPKWDRKALQRDFEHVFPAGFQASYKTLTISLHAPDPSAAQDRARRVFDVRRALWNWYLNRDKWTQHIGIPKPLNRVLWGPITTVHRPDGTLARDGFSYDDEFRVDRATQNLKNLGAVLKFERAMTRRMRRSPIAKELEQFLVGYVRALDHADQLTAFQSLWPVFESITGGLDARYDRNFRRMLACYSTTNREAVAFIGQELEHLREFRNNLVHEGRATAQVWIAVQQLKAHVHAALGVFFEVLSQFSNLESAYDFLDLPRNEVDLKRQADLLRKAIVLRYPKRKRAV